jgi:hypothetical protein
VELHKYFNVLETRPENEKGGRLDADGPRRGIRKEFGALIGYGGINHYRIFKIPARMTFSYYKFANRQKLTSKAT